MTRWWDLHREQAGPHVPQQAPRQEETAGILCTAGVAGCLGLSRREGSRTGAQGSRRSLGEPPAPPKHPPSRKPQPRAATQSFPLELFPGSSLITQAKGPVVQAGEQVTPCPEQGLRWPARPRVSCDSNSEEALGVGGAFWTSAGSALAGDREVSRGGGG